MTYTGHIIERGKHGNMHVPEVPREVFRKLAGRTEPCYAIETYHLPDGLGTLSISRCNNSGKDVKATFYPTLTHISPGTWLYEIATVEGIPTFLFSEQVSPPEDERGDFDDSFEALRKRLIELEKPKTPRTPTGPRGEGERSEPSTIHRDFMVQCDVLALEQGLIPGPGDDRSWPDRQYLRLADASVFGYFEFKSSILDNADQIKRMIWLKDRKQYVRAGRTVERFKEFLAGITNG